MKIFFDTGVFIALFSSTEKYHKQVSGKFNEYRKKRALFYTSYYVLDELFTRLIYDFGKSITENIISILMKSIDKGEMDILDIDEAIFKKSLLNMLKFSEHKISFTDATIYTLYKDLELTEIFTLDSDFKKIGAVTSI